MLSTNTFKYMPDWELALSLSWFPQACLSIPSFIFIPTFTNSGWQEPHAIHIFCYIIQSSYVSSLLSVLTYTKAKAVFNYRHNSYLRLLHRNKCKSVLCIVYRYQIMICFLVPQPVNLPLYVALVLHVSFPSLSCSDIILCMLFYGLQMNSSFCLGMFITQIKDMKVFPWHWKQQLVKSSEFLGNTPLSASLVAFLITGPAFMEGKKIILSHNLNHFSWKLKINFTSKSFKSRIVNSGVSILCYN